MLAADVDTAINTGWKVLADFGVAVFLALVLLLFLLAVVYWVLVIRWPKMESDADARLLNLRTACQAEREELREQFRQSQAAFLAALEQQQHTFTLTLDRIEERTRAIADDVKTMAEKMAVTIIEGLGKKLDRLSMRVDVLDSRRQGSRKPEIEE